MIKNIFYRRAMGLAVLGAFVAIPVGRAAIPTFSAAAGLAYQQNFDGLGTSTANWNDDSTIGGWFLTDNNNWRNGGPVSLPVDTGGTAGGSNGNFFNYGTSGGSDRALGSVPRNSGQINLRPQFIGLALGYTGTVPLSQLQVIYTGEWWRDGLNGTDSLTFSYRITTTVPTFAQTTWDNTATWNGVSSLDFTVTGDGSNVANMDGSSQKNVAFSASVPAGNVTTQYILLRWTHTDVASQNEHGLAINNVFVAVPETGTWAAGALIGGLLIHRVRRSRQIPA